MLSSLLDKILGLSPVWVYLVVFLLVFAEDAIFIGFVVPGETAAVLAGVSTSVGQADLAVAIIVVCAAAIIGDSVGYEVGKHFFGPKIMDASFIRDHRLLRDHSARINDAEEFLARRGGSAVFLGRFVAFFRAMMPALSGATGMPYRRFLPWNALGGIVWGTTFVVIGHVAGSSYAAVEKTVGRGLAIAVAVIVVAVVIVWRVRSSRAEKRKESGYVDPSAAERTPN